jgi:hypothetical protein
MFGATTYNVLQVDGTFFTVRWDVVMPVNIFITFNATSINGTSQPHIAQIRAGLVTDFVPGVFQEVNITALGTAVQVIDSNTLVTGAGFTTGSIQILNLSGVAASGVFVINYSGAFSAAINWNDSILTIQSKVQAVTGLSTVTVTGSIASQVLTFNLSSIQNVQGFIYVTGDTLLTSGAVAVTFSYNEGYTNTLLPAQKDLQFVVSSSNIIILPMILNPVLSTVAHTSGTIAFLGVGGYGALTYSFQTNNSGGAVNSTSGAYTAGATFPVVDTLLVTDVMGNIATAVVNVT